MDFHSAFGDYILDKPNDAKQASYYKTPRRLRHAVTNSRVLFNQISFCETRTLTRAGYARFRDFLLYGERALSGQKVLINIFQDTLALEYGEQPLAKYSVEWQPDDKHLLRVGNPRLYNHPYHGPQLDLWPFEAVEWFVILKATPYGPRPRHKRSGRVIVMQPPLLQDA